MFFGGGGPGCKELALFPVRVQYSSCCTTLIKMKRNNQSSVTRTLGEGGGVINNYPSSLHDSRVLQIFTTGSVHVLYCTGSVALYIYEDQWHALQLPYNFFKHIVLPPTKVCTPPPRPRVRRGFVNSGVHCTTWIFVFTMH